VVLQRKHQTTSGQLQKESIFLQGVLLDPHLAIEVDTVILTSEKISQFHVNLDIGFLLSFTADFCLSYFQVDRLIMSGKDQSWLKHRIDISRRSAATLWPAKWGLGLRVVSVQFNEVGLQEYCMKSNRWWKNFVLRKSRVSQILNHHCLLQTLTSTF
jgi:hypothetical protein